jgi:DNA-binding GntR family transcriptional regulator
MAPPCTLVQSVTLLVPVERGSFADLMVVRKSLECTAATLAASRADSESLGAIRQCIDRMSRVAERGLNDPANYFLYGELDQEFHLLIAKASRNVSLESILSAVIPMTMSGRFDIIRSLGNMDIFFGRPDIGVAHDHHNAIASSIASRDPTLAEALVDRHLTRAATIYTSLERLVSEPNAPSASYQE